MSSAAKIKFLALDLVVSPFISSTCKCVGATGKHMPENLIFAAEPRDCEEISRAETLEEVITPLRIPSGLSKSFQFLTISLHKSYINNT